MTTSPDPINATLGSPIIQLLHQLEDNDFATQLARTSALSAAWKFHPLRRFANQRPLPQDHNG